jgi:hypothetical protein
LISLKIDTVYKGDFFCGKILAQFPSAVTISLLLGQGSFNKIFKQHYLGVDMKSIKWVVLSALVMGLSVNAAEDVDGNPNRRRVSPCCNVGRIVKAIPAACLLTLATLAGQTQGARAQAENEGAVAVAKPVNILPAGVLIEEGVPCFGVKGKLLNGNLICVKRLMCNYPAANPEAEQFEHGRLVGHLERLAKHNEAGRPRIKELEIVPGKCGWGEGNNHYQSIQCARGAEALQYNDIAFGEDCIK